ncbi:hypothetical protein D4R99_05220 [bacterium]|nr:MAG: hypothetical protein D4R99_05220 [bacterium]
MNGNNNMNGSKTTSIILFAFGILFTIIGYLVVDRLSSIDNNTAELKSDIKEIRVDNARQDRELTRHEELIKEGVISK